MSVYPGGAFKVARLVLPAGGIEPDASQAAGAAVGGTGLSLGGEGESLARLPPPGPDWVRVAGKYGGAGGGVRPSAGKTGAGADFKPMSGPHVINRSTSPQAGSVKADTKPDAARPDASGSRNVSQPVVRYLKLPDTAAQALTKRWGVSDQPGGLPSSKAGAEKTSAETAATARRVEDAAKPLIDFVTKAAQQAAQRHVKFEPAAGASAAAVHSGVNPTGAKLNCQACTIAVDLKAAGVQSGTGISAKSVEAGNLPIKHMEAFYGRQFEPMKLGKIFESMSAAGDGARGIVWGLRQGVDTPGHVFNVLNVGGRLKFVDGQTGKNASFEGYSGFRFMRTD